jgi:RHS repeat-associated protein
MLGSVRLVTDTNQIVVARHDFIPFGEEIPNGTAGRNGDFGYTSNVTQGFTGQEADGGTASLDFYNARHFATTLGSFVQPDPMNAGATLLRPQSWNAYAYVLGNPLGAADPTGLQCASRGGLHANMVGCNGGGEYGGTDDPTGGGGGGVSIDGGSPVSIGTFGSGSNPAGGESGTQCPNNACSIVIWSSSPVGTSGLLQQFSGFASGGSGYYSTYGPGSLNYTAQQAGVAAVTYINPTSIAQNVEYSGNVYKDANGIFSFVMPTMGTFNHSPFDPTQVPSGTVYAGAYHTHGGDDPNLPAMDSEVFSPPFNGQLNDIGLYSSPANQGQPAYLGTPAGRVEVYNPQTNKSCVLVGSAVPGISSGVGLVGGVPTCH